MLVLLLSPKRGRRRISLIFIAASWRRIVESEASVWCGLRVGGRRWMVSAAAVCVCVCVVVVATGVETITICGLTVAGTGFAVEHLLAWADCVERCVCYGIRCGRISCLPHNQRQGRNGWRRRCWRRRRRQRTGGQDRGDRAVPMAGAGRRCGRLLGRQGSRQRQVRHQHRPVVGTGKIGPVLLESLLVVRRGPLTVIVGQALRAQWRRLLVVLSDGGAGGRAHPTRGVRELAQALEGVRAATIVVGQSIAVVGLVATADELPLPLLLVLVPQIGRRRPHVVAARSGQSQLECRTLGPKRMSRVACIRRRR